MTSTLADKNASRLTEKRNEVLQLEHVTTAQEITKIALNQLHLITCLQNKHLINTREQCNTCGIPMTLVMRKNSKGHYGFLCKKCHNVCPLSKGTFFEKNKMSYEGVLLTLFSWACRVKAQCTAVLYGITLPKVVRQYQCFREVCTLKMTKYPIIIGGVDNIVEVDENLFTIPSKEESSEESQNFVVGMYSHEDLSGIVLLVKDKSGDTLLNLIKKHIIPGTTVWTNDVNGLQKLTLNGYPHATFQQSAGAHIEYLPRYWSSVKTYLQNNYRLKPHQITQDYLNEYLWMSKYGQTHIEAFRNMLLHISEFYPTNKEKIV